MPVIPVGVFPTMQEIMDLSRSTVNDMFPGTGGQNGRILTNDAAFTLPHFNSALRTVQRKLRNEGVTFPIKDNIILNNVTPVVQIDPAVQVYIGFNGYFDGTTLHPTPALPPDCMQPQVLWEQTANSALPFVRMSQPQEGLLSVFQGPWMGYWEWRQYRIFMPGSTQTKNFRLRYLSGQPPLNVPAANFSTTYVNIIDSQEAVAFEIAVQYGDARGADTTKVAAKGAMAIDDMAQEWVRRQQTVTYRRQPYGGGNSSGPLGSNDTPGRGFA